MRRFFYRNSYSLVRIVCLLAARKGERERQERNNWKRTSMLKLLDTCTAYRETCWVLDTLECQKPTLSKESYSSVTMTRRSSQVCCNEWCQQHYCMLKLEQEKLLLLSGDHETMLSDGWKERRYTESRNSEETSPVTWCGTATFFDVVLYMKRAQPQCLCETIESWSQGFGNLVQSVQWISAQCVGRGGVRGLSDLLIFSIYRVIPCKHETDGHG